MQAFVQLVLQVLAQVLAGDHHIGFAFQQGLSGLLLHRLGSEGQFHQGFRAHEGQADNCAALLGGQVAGAVGGDAHPHAAGNHVQAHVALGLGQLVFHGEAQVHQGVLVVLAGLQLLGHHLPVHRLAGGFNGSGIAADEAQAQLQVAAQFSRVAL